jgi:hypothetical protein
MAVFYTMAILWSHIYGNERRIYLIYSQMCIQQVWLRCFSIDLRLANRYVAHHTCSIRPFYTGHGNWADHIELEGP